MEDYRRPSDEVFDDICQAATRVWINGNYHPDYTDEKVAQIMRMTNYADNWNHIIGMFDGNNQLLMCCYLKLQASLDFLKSMQPWYFVALPREKV